MTSVISLDQASSSTGATGSGEPSAKKQKSTYEEEGMELEEPPVEKGKSAYEEERAEEILIHNFISQLRKVDSSYYVFQRYNYLKNPDPNGSFLLHGNHEVFDHYENLPNPIQGRDFRDGHVKHFSYEKMSQITNDFSPLNFMRQCSRGRYLRGRHDGEDVVVRTWDCFLPITFACSRHPELFSRQLEFLLNRDVASHPNVVNLRGYCCDKIFALVLDLKLDSILHDLIPNDSFDWGRRMTVAKQVASALEFLHKRGFALGCFFAPCITVDEKDDYKIQFFELDYVVNLGNDDLLAVEKFYGGDYRYYSSEFRATMDYKRGQPPKTDVYRFGILLLELTLAKCADLGGVHTWVECGRKAFRKGERYSRFSKSLFVPQTMCFELAMQCVQDNPTLRPSMDAILIELNKILSVSQGL